MSILLTTSDFSGFYVVNLNTANTPILQTYIDRYEKEGILRLLGVELGLLFIADLANVSQDVRFTVLQDPFQLTLNQTDKISRGMVDFLCAYVLYHYVKDRQIRITDNGVALSVNEAQTIVSPKEANRYGEKKFNELLDTVEAIRWYCIEYAPATYPSTPSRLYPEFNGEEIQPIYSPLI
jgi:hypothetical protein